MRAPTISDEQLLAAAEALHKEGRLSIRRLRERVGGGDTGRLSRVAREVRATAPEELRSVAEGEGKQDPGAEPELPKPVQTDLDRLGATVLRELEHARQREVDRARAAESALTTRHEEEVNGLVGDITLLREDMSELEAAVEEHLEEIAQLEASEADMRAALAQSENERRSAAEMHAEERRTLSDNAARLESERAQEAEGRRRAEATLDEARTRIADLGAELQREREETAKLRTLVEKETARRAELDLKCAGAVEAAETSAARVTEVETALRAAELELTELRGKVQAQDALTARLEKVLGSAQKPAARARAKKS